jgi:hypothetical protein
LNDDYSLITVEGASKRGWSSQSGPDLQKVRDMVRKELSSNKELRVSQLKEKLHETGEGIRDSMISEAIVDLSKEEKCIIYQGASGQDKRPEKMATGGSAVFHELNDNEVIISPSEASQKGWLESGSSKFEMDGPEAAEILFPMIRSIGSLYNKGASSKIDLLEIYELVLNKGGRIRIEIAEVPPESMKGLGEFFEILASLVQPGSKTGATLEISDPQKDCIFLKEIEERKQGN